MTSPGALAEFGVHIVRRPKTHLLASALVLVILAGCAGLARYNYDDRKTLPASVESSIGYAALDKHFPSNLIIPEYLFIQSSTDLRTPKALADLEQMVQRVSQVPGVAMVRALPDPLDGRWSRPGRPGRLAKSAASWMRVPSRSLCTPATSTNWPVEPT